MNAKHGKIQTDQGVSEVRPISRMSESDLDSLVNTLEVSFIKLTECLIGRNWRLIIPELELPGVHYILRGHGRMIIQGRPPINVSPHTLIILPRKTEFGLEVEVGNAPVRMIRAAQARWPLPSPGGVLTKVVAGETDHEVVLICGYFRARYGRTLDLFGDLTAPIVEQFDVSNKLDERLKDTMRELLAQEAGMGAMTSALMKTVFVSLFRRSISSSSLWVERFAMISDRNVARAFADMVARPGAPHTTQSLSRFAGLSRSIFMARFTKLFGRSPMDVLRELRMRHAAAQLMNEHYHVDQVAYSAGYSNRSSFCRAFKKAYGVHPSEYRASETDSA